MIDQLKRIYAILYQIRCIVAKYRTLMTSDQQRDFDEIDRLMTELHQTIYGEKNAK